MSRTSFMNRPGAPRGKPGDYQVVPTPRTLQAKVGTGFGMNAQLVERMEIATEELTDDFRDMLQGDIGRLAAALDRAEASPTVGGQSAATIHAVASDLHGYGGSYDFHLVTVIGDRMRRLIERHMTLPAPLLPALRAHVDALRAVLKDGVRGDGGPIGRDLVACLKVLSDRAESQIASAG